MSSEVLSSKIHRLSRRPDGGDPSPTNGETIVLAIGIENVGVAFELAEATLKERRIVRVIAPGATLEASWPPWVQTHRELRLTEPGAFNHDPLVISTWDLQQDLKAWLDETFAGAFVGRPADLLFTSACARFLQTAIATYPIAKALAETFPNATFVCVDEGFHTINGGWDPELFAQIAVRLGAKVESRANGNKKKRPSRVQWAAKILGVGAAALVGSVGRQLRDFVGARKSRAKVRRLRARHQPDAPLPSLWLTIIPDWARVNSIAIDAFGLPALERGESIGVLLVDNLRQGTRDETDLRRVVQSTEELWPGLGALQTHIDRCVVDQAVQPDSAIGFARALLLGGRGSLVALGRVAQASSSITTREGFAIDLHKHLWPMVSLATLDVLRGAIVEGATSNLLKRVGGGFSERIAVVSCSSTVSLAAVDTTLQRGGGITLNSPDGSGSDTWTGVGSTVSTARVVWTEADARSIGRSCDQVIVAGMPLRMKMPPRQSLPQNILLLNNHGHREFSVGGVFRERAFQRELLRIPHELRLRGFHNLVFRWRPHPAATENSIRDGMASVDQVELSTNRLLEVDAEWADLVVCGYSTSIIEILFASIPVFVQARSELLGLPAHDFLNDDRVFFFASEGADKISSYLRAWPAVNISVRLASENKARERLFGSAMVPRPASDALRFADRTSGNFLARTNK